MRRTRDPHRLVLAAVMLPAMLLAACGGEDAGSATGAGGETTAAGTDDVSATGEAPSPENIATYEGEDRQEVLEACAAEEGMFHLYTNPTTDITEALIDGFTAQYPDISVEVTRGGSSELAQRIAEEHSAGLHQFDVVETSVSVLNQLRQEGIVQPYFTPQGENFAEGARDQEGYFVSSRESHIGLGYNTDLVSEDEVPTSYEDLLDPRYEGRMAIPGSATGVRFVANLESEYGEDFIAELAEQDISLQNISGRALADLVVSGEVALSPAIYDSHVSVSSEEGAPVAWQPLEPVIALPTGPSLASEAQHPCSALLYIDFILSEEGQQVYVEHGYQTAREDIETEGVDYEKTYIDTREDYLERFSEWENMLQQYFVSG